MVGLHRGRNYFNFGPLWHVYSDIKFPFLLASHHEEKLDLCDRVHPLGTYQSCRASDPLFCGVSGHICDHSGRQPGHDIAHPLQCQTSHSHVLFPEPLILCGYVLLLQCDSKNAPDFPFRKDNYFLPCMFGSVLPLHCPGPCWDLHPSSDGLWSVHGHLQPPTLW